MFITPRGRPRCIAEDRTEVTLSTVGDPVEMSEPVLFLALIYFNLVKTK